MQFSLKKATIHDLSKVAKLFDHYRVFYHQESDLDKATSFIEERIHKSESTIFLADSESHGPCGFVQLYPSFSSVGMKRTLILNDLYVCSSARKQGIASELIKAAENYAKETKSSGLILETAHDNFNAQKLYEKMGWIKSTNFFYTKNV